MNTKLGRPTNSSKRKVQILLAFEWCIANYGVEGATLDKVAKRAGLARALIRHHIGNRDELLEKFVENFLDSSQRNTDLLFETLPESNTVKVLIDSLFNEDYSDQQFVLVFSALIIAAKERPNLAIKLRNCIDSFINHIYIVLKKQFPKYDQRKLKTIAVGITGIYFNADSLLPLGGVEELRTLSKQAAMLLVENIQ